MQTDANTGKPLDRFRHVRQSIRDIITTPLGSRLMNPEYGCGLFEYVDAPLTGGNILRISQVIHAALVRWERRVRIVRTEVLGIVQNGKFQIVVYFEPENERDQTLERIEVQA